MPFRMRRGGMDMLYAFAVSALAGLSTGLGGLVAVSYTHLDVYKRQTPGWLLTTA